jgi:hypothetical protein
MPTELAWDGKGKEGMRIQDLSGLSISLVSMDMNGKPSETAGTVYSQAGLALDWGEATEARLTLRVAPFSPGGESFSMSMSELSLKPIPVAREKALPTPAPILAVLPTPRPTLEPAPEPAKTPSPRPPHAAPGQVLSSKATIRVHSRLQGDRMAFAFLPQPEPKESRGPSRALDEATLRRLRLASIPLVLDLFAWESPYEAPGFEGKLEAAWQRYRGLGFKRLRLTGLLQQGESGGEDLSRGRAMRMSALLSGKGFKGEFVIWVDGKAGKAKGVRIEVLK